MCVAGVRGVGVALAFERPELFQPPAALGGYLLLDRVAEGGMASVFRGQHRDSGDIVAIKTVRTAKSHEIASLSREIEVLRRLRHPGIVRFVSDGTWNDVPWMAMELLEGKTLFEEIRSMWLGIRQDLPRIESRRSVAWRATGCCPSRNASEIGAGGSSIETRVNDATWLLRMDADPALAAPMRPAAAGQLYEAVSFVERLAKVLDHLHRQGFVHCDVKPENVIVGRTDRTTLLDFGLACRLRNRRAEVDENPLYMGTVEYAAPEQLCGGPVDIRTDTYSLGCILYEMITGRLVFDGLSPGEIVQRHLDEDPVAPSELVSDVPWQLEDLVFDMLAKRPGDRPRNPGEVLGKLKRLIPRSA
jgi:serine/threonine protein kinase